MGKSEHELLAIARISEAFKGISRPSREEILEDSFGDEQELADFIASKWEDIAEDLWRVNPVEVALLNCNAMVYFLPGFLVGILRKDYAECGSEQDAIVALLDPTNPLSRPCLERAKRDLFTPEQRAAIATFLELCDLRAKDYPDSKRVYKEQILYWKPNELD